MGRISGDEFLIVADGLDAVGCSGAGRPDQTGAGAPFLLDAGEVFVTASIGIAVSYGSAPEDAATLIRDADTAMYRSKDAGRNAITVFDVSMLRTCRQAGRDGATNPSGVVGGRDRRPLPTARPVAERKRDGLRGTGAVDTTRRG